MMSTMADLLLALAVIATGLYAGFMLIFQTVSCPRSPGCPTTASCP
ncbi:hypothetical protein [Streptomyces sp. NPDC059015]